MTGPRAVHFDLDGTLVDSRPGIVASVGHALHKLGHVPDSAADLSFLLGPPIASVMGQVLAPYGDDRVVFDGIPDLLAALTGAGFRLYVATSKREHLARLKLAHFGLDSCFAGIHGSQPGGARDHKSDLIRHVLDSEGLEANRTAMVGDRQFDIAGALANEIPAIGALWGYGSREELEAAGATAVADSPREIPVLVEAHLPR